MNTACFCQSGACRPAPNMCAYGGVLATRDGLIQRPELTPFIGRDFAQTNSRPAPQNGDWGEQVEIENRLRNFENRAVGGGCTSTRNFVTPLSLSMTPLVHGWQQPDDYGRYQESSRMTVKDVCRPMHCDSLEGRNYESRPCPNAYFDCDPNKCLAAMQQRRTTLI